MNDLLFYIFAFSAAAEMVVLEYVIRQVDVDRLNSLDPERVRWARKITFFLGQGYLFLTVMFQIWGVWVPDLITLLIAIGFVWAGILILGVNVVSLHLRTPPRPGTGYFAAWQRATRWGRTPREERKWNRKETD